MNVIGVILGGGAGTRLQPLTAKRSKPAVPLAGRHRLVDIPISNCINSDIKQIYLLTQYNSASLHRHVQSTYNFDAFSNGFVRLLAAEQTPESGVWFQGTADAVRQSMEHLKNTNPDLVVILSGDQLYRMDFGDVIVEHISKGASITVCSKPVSRKEASDLGILQVNDSNKIIRFVEKPKEESLLDELSLPRDSSKYLASMGIYIFNAGVLESLLEETSGIDFGRHVIPYAVEKYNVYSYIFDGYWKDIGTIGMFWEANIALAGIQPEFNFYDSEAPIYTRRRSVPPTKIFQCWLSECMVAEGCILHAERIERTVVGLRSIIQEGTIIDQCVIMGNDYYEFGYTVKGDVPLGIGRNCNISKAIIDKNVRIGDNVVISPGGKEDTDTAMYSIKDGIVVIKNGTVIPNNTVI